MYPFTAKLGFSNSCGKSQVVAVEPWGNDYTLLPGEELEILAFSDSALPWIHVVVWEGTSQVYCQDSADFRVFQKGVELQCGHNRQPEDAAERS